MNRNKLFFLFFLSLFCLSCSNKSKLKCNTSLIIPQPASISFTEGSFHLSENSSLFLDVPLLYKEKVLQMFVDFPFKEHLKTIENSGGGVVNVVLSFDSTRFSSKEAYRIEVLSDKINISACGLEGLFYAAQSLLQLYNNASNAYIQCQIIDDSPLFPHRALLLDVSRHYFTTEFIKKQIATMGHYKMNKLLLYIAGDAAWRLQIEKYPWLTELAAWRSESRYMDWKKSNGHFCASDSPSAYGGTYSKDELIDLVEYARKYSVEIIPMIDIPFVVKSLNDVYSPQINPNNIFSQTQILKDVVDETMAIFSSNKIYFGDGNEDAFRATACVSCLPRVAEGDEVDASEARNIFIRAIEDHLNKQGLRLIAWESAIRGGINKESSAIVAWHQTRDGVEAAEMGFDVIMSPSSFSSLDYYQTNPSISPEAMSGLLSLEQLYNYNPLVDMHDHAALDKIIGVQANMWSSYCPSSADLEFMLYPRLFALSEVSWTRPQRKSFLDFRKRIEFAYNFLRANDQNSFDLKNEEAIRPESNEPLNSLAKNAKVSYNSIFDERFPAAGKTTLTDGERGGWSYVDGRWQGFQNMDLDVTLDLRTELAVQKISATFMHDRSGKIFLPYHVEILGSEDGQSYFLIGAVSNNFDVEEKAYSLVPFVWSGKAKTRFIRYIAKYKGVADGWLFMDEIVVN